MMINFLKYYQRILCVGAHLDDIEFGCGATIADLVGSEREIHFLTLSQCNKSSTGKLQLQRDISEAYRAAQQIGLHDNDLSIEGLDGQQFPQQRQKIREILLEWKRKFNPDLILCPSRQDFHQDHQALSEEAVRIFRLETCLGYEVVRSSLYFQPNFYNGVSNESVEKKIKALLCYQSQINPLVSAVYYFDPDIIRSMALFRGGQVNQKFAEAFELYCIITRFNS
jgi:LmbE family N-acetylglucosaminyl deacetylase